MSFERMRTETVDLMDLVVNSDFCVFCNSLKYKDNSRCRLEAGAPRGDFFNTGPTRSTVTANGLGPRSRNDGRDARETSRRGRLRSTRPRSTVNGLGPRPTVHGQRSRPTDSAKAGRMPVPRGHGTLSQVIGGGRNYLIKKALQKQAGIQKSPRFKGLAFRCKFV